MPPSINKEIEKKVKDYDRDLFIEWDYDLERWALKRKAEGTTHHVFFIQNEDGSFRPLDDRLIKEIYECDIWRHFGNAENYHKFIQDHNAQVALKAKNIRQEYLRWYNKEHKKEWAQAIDNARSGII